MKDFETEDTFGVDDPPRQRHQERVTIEGETEAQAELFDALAKAQGELTDAFKGAEHTTFGKYAELQDYTAVIRPVFSKHGLSYVQLPVCGPDDIHRIYLETIVAKGSARIRTVSSAPVPTPNRGTNELQVRGIAISYERRYALAAVTGMATTDNQGEVSNETVPFSEFQIKQLDAAASQGVEAFKELRLSMWADIKDAWAGNPQQTEKWKHMALEADQNAAA